jgi:hypothetical protein
MLASSQDIDKALEEIGKIADFSPNSTGNITISTKIGDVVPANLTLRRSANGSDTVPLGGESLG